MVCVVGGVSLNHTPIWVDRHRYYDSITETTTAINGNEIVQVNARGRQFPITLESTAETGWLKGSTVTALRALSAVAGAYYTLMLNGTNYTVRFRNEQPGGAIQMQTLLLLSNPGVNDWYYGTIYLMCVG